MKTTSTEWPYRPDMSDGERESIATLYLMLGEVEAEKLLRRSDARFLRRSVELDKE